ncbi:hypothetical protein [Dyella acidisoli]|uniref:Flagellin C-terminal domain-containing protein n=1 Tax=Dyella acidisoli TaxID=1867834 RepID=A0ABQ5XRM0_9GAMM|nr:hypothetical protein [Dyella acidisoli]GLQ94218.1 hypothetical protein GCM10007901_31690 [Dyella acidisoli]
MNRFGLPLCGIGLLGFACCAGMAHAQDRAPIPNSIAGFGVPVSMERLDAVRGGFDLGDGLQASLGIQRAVYVDGNLVTYINVTIPDIAHITTQQAVSLAEALGTVDVQVGTGNTFDPSSSVQTNSVAAVTQAVVNSTVSHAVSAAAPSSQTSPASQTNAATVVQNTLSSPLVTSTVIPASAAAQANAATVIQNTVDNQVIRSLTTLSISINALNALRNQGLQQSLQTAQQLQALSH